MQKSIMNWHNFRQLKGQSVQDYTQEFRRRDLMLVVDLNSQDKLLKCIGVLVLELALGLQQAPDQTHPKL